MLPSPKNYAIYPSIVLADTEVQISITAHEKAFLPVEGAEYEITLIGNDNDELGYHSPISHKHVTVTAQKGVITFPFTFTGEQAYLAKLYRDSVLLAELPLYSLKKDLYELEPLKSDFHAHSFRSDGKRDPAALAGHYREQAYDCFALTDHNRFYPGGEIDETYAGVDMEFFRIRGEEVHTPGSIVHIVHVGGRNSVAEQYVKDMDGFETEVQELLKQVPKEIPDAYKDRYARAMWATKKIHKAGGLAIFPHPFWKPKGSQTNNVCSEFSKILLKSGMFDAYELIGGMEQHENNLSVALWNDLRADGVRISVVGSSDVHSIEKSSLFPHYFTLCFAKDRSPDAIMEAIKQGNTVAVESCGTEYDRQYRCYGNLRLVAYAQFLLRNFYREMERICAGEGVAMRAYALGDADKELIELQAKQSRIYRERFFGRIPPQLPSDKMLDFEERWREAQRNGPKTRGSAIISSTVNFQI